MSADLHHTVTAEWDDRYGFGPSLSFRCNAPDESLCHAVYGVECSCEEWSQGGIEDGRPYHVARMWDEAADDHAEVRHYGQFDPTACNLTDWFENTDEALRGSVTFPVADEWQGDYYLFRAAGGAA